MLLDIFVADAARRFSIKVKVPDEDKEIEVPMWSILKPKLDELLVPTSEFLSWSAEMTARIRAVEEGILELKSLMKSVKPLNYKGRIIVSTTDALEREVIEHYGGKRWRRIMNFLRGVEMNDKDLGRKFGERYVCLRESNVPIHTHKVQLDSTSTTLNNGWAGKRRIG